MADVVNLPSDKVRALQRVLYVAAKQQRQRRFHALYDRITRPDVLRESWKRVKRNRGAAGIDGETLEAIAARGEEQMLVEPTTCCWPGSTGRRRCAGCTSPSPEREGNLVP